MSIKTIKYFEKIRSNIKRAYRLKQMIKYASKSSNLYQYRELVNVYKELIESTKKYLKNIEYPIYYEYLMKLILEVERNG